MESFGEGASVPKAGKVTTLHDRDPRSSREMQQGSAVGLKDGCPQKGCLGGSDCRETIAAADVTVCQHSPVQPASGIL